MNNTQSVVFQVLVKTGSKNEDKKINGISHFLEHLVFKGTKKRPKPGTISKELDRIGADHNAFTGKEITGFWVKLASKDFDIGFDVISDMVLNPIFDTKEIEKERGVILQEISSYEDQFSSKALMYVEEMLYEGNPHSMMTLGTNDSVKNILRNDILKYRKERYISNNMIVIVVGNIDGNDALKKIKKVFSKLKADKEHKIPPPKIKQNDINIKIKNKKCDQSHLAVGVRAYGLSNEKKYILEILSVVLGGNMSSRLFKELREKRGLAYYVGASNMEYEDSGYLLMRAGVPKDKINTVFQVFSKLLNDFKKRPVSKSELHSAKEFIRGKMSLTLEHTEYVADFFGEQELFYNKILTPQEIMEKIEKVTASDIMKVAGDIFRPENINIAGIIPEDGKSMDPDKIRNIFLK
ncbi:MAG: insulinase family protein [Parcubacteria group bacterium]|nr:insulinase family protein [Parcubacteria group bacterium]